jgi:hypothetical protein
MMNRRDFETLLLTLESTPALLARAAVTLSPAQHRCRPSGGGFSFVENVWHLADLEREGYGLRIRRMLAEDTPALLNFDGERTARERCYNEKDLARGIDAFARERTQNLEVLRRLSASEWKRAGALEGVGRVTLEDLPRMMAEHDRSHGDEIATLLAEARGERLCRPRTSSAVA